MIRASYAADPRNAPRGGLHHTHCRTGEPPAIPTREIEQFVVDEIEAIGGDPALVAATVAESRRLVHAGIKRLTDERAALDRQRRVDEAELAKLVATVSPDPEAGRIAEI